MTEPTDWQKRGVLQAAVLADYLRGQHVTHYVKKRDRMNSAGERAQ